MVKLRLKRMGASNQPFYRVVAVDSRAKRDGKYIEAIGYYDPKTDPLTLKLDDDIAIKWLKCGAQPTETVRALFRRAGILAKFHEMRFGKTDGSSPMEEPSAIEE
jgi:small subunit ribosomal protein S16